MRVKCLAQEHNTELRYNQERLRAEGAIFDSKARVDLFQATNINAITLILKSALVQEGIMIITRCLQVK